VYKLVSVKEDGMMQVIGFTSYRKFVVVTFQLAADRIIVEDVNLPADYETVEQAIFDGLGTQPD
jgi:hypothetical protein